MNVWTPIQYVTSIFELSYYERTLVLYEVNLLGPYPQAYEIARYLDFIENISLQTLHSTSKDLLDGQEDIESIEAEIDSKLAHIDSCLADLNFEKGLSDKLSDNASCTH